MDFLAEGFRRAWDLLVTGDSEVYGIALLTLRVAVVATFIACAIGLPLGYFLATRRFWGRRAALTVVNTALAFPTVVVGLLLYGLLSRRGPLGAIGWLYTWQAIVVGDVLLALPIAAALSAASIQGVDPRIRRTAAAVKAAPHSPAPVHTIFGGGIQAEGVLCLKDIVGRELIARAQLQISRTSSSPSDSTTSAVVVLRWTSSNASLPSGIQPASE